MERTIVGRYTDVCGQRHNEEFTIIQAKEWLIEYGVPNAKYFSEDEVIKNFYEYFN